MKKIVRKKNDKLKSISRFLFIYSFVRRRFIVSSFSFANGIELSSMLLLVPVHIHTQHWCTRVELIEWILNDVLWTFSRTHHRLALIWTGVHLINGLEQINLETILLCAFFVSHILYFETWRCTNSRFLSVYCHLTYVIFPAETNSPSLSNVIRKCYGFPRLQFITEPRNKMECNSMHCV